MFDEDTPAALLETLRPDVWVKGGDYTVSDLPEAPVVHRHGGEIVDHPAGQRVLDEPDRRRDPDHAAIGDPAPEEGERMRPLGNVLITGGASGLGAATVDAVLAAGGRPLVLDRNAPSLDVDHVQADLADRVATENAVAALVAAEWQPAAVGVHRRRDRLLRSVRRGARRRVGAGGRGEPAGYRPGGAGRAAAPRAVPGSGGDLLVHVGPARSVPTRRPTAPRSSA